MSKKGRKIKDTMKYLKLLLIIALVHCSNVFSQEKLIKHTVKKGETITAIAQKYKVDPKAIYELNPDCSRVLKLESIILIPRSTLKGTQEKTETKVAVVATTHEVQPKETLYSIAKQYEISLEEINTANPELADKGLQAGQKINLPVKVNSKNSLALVIEEKKEIPKEVIDVVTRDVPVEQNQETIIHVVLPKETKFGIAKKYGISVTELVTQNPSVLKNLYVGAKLTILAPKSAQNYISDVKVVNSESSDVISSQENLTIASSVAEWKTNEELAEELVRMASDNLGTRYRSGGSSKNGFDCSGLIYSAFNSLDIKLPRSSREMATIGNVVAVHDAKKGDLIFFKTRGGNRINHVGMVVEVLDSEIRFIHSATHGGVIISSTKEKYYEKNFTQINRVLQQ